MSNGHSAEAIEATVTFSEDLRGPDGPSVPESAGWEQQEDNEKQRQEHEWQKADQEEVDAIQLKKSITKSHEARMKELTGEKPPATRKEFLNKLVKDHGLVIDDDIFNKDGKWAIIKLSGVEKIQNNLNIRVTFESEKLERDWAVIKATAVGQRDSVQSYGEATKGSYPNGNVSHTYVVAMAEKRAKARSVLKLCGAYKYGVYSEDESEEFKQDS
jgi:hypothetical protein